MEKNSKKPKTTFTANEVAVLVEGLRSDFRVFGEDLSSVKKRLDMLFEELGKQKEDIFAIKTDIRIMKADIQKLKEDVGIIKIDVAEIKEAAKDHAKRLTHLEAIK